MRLKDEFGKDHTVRIGTKPFVYFPACETSITVCIPCFTRHDFASDISCLFSGTTSEYNFSNINNESIGVRIDKIPRWCIENFFWKKILTDEFEPEKWSEWSDEQTTEFISILNFFNNLWSNSLTMKFRFIFLLSIIISHNNAKNNMIQWKKTTIIPSFIRSTEVNMKADIDNETDEYGNFKVNVNISNNLKVDVYALILVDMSDRSFINSLFPMLKGLTIYNVGNKSIFIKASEKKSVEIQCKFPDNGFDEKTYDIVVECAPYLPMNESNMYGIYFFNMRWKMLIKPYYIVNGKVTSMIRDMWYNTPIFYSKPVALQQIFQTQRKNIVYNGNRSIDILVNDITDSLIDQPLFLIIIIFLIGAPYTLIVLLIYRNIRESTSTKIVRRKNKKTR